MFRNIQNQSQLKSLPAFIYSREIKTKETDINKIIGAMGETLTQYIDSSIKTSFALTREKLNVMVDIPRMQEALINLIKNAKDAMPLGGMLTLSTKKIDYDSGLYSYRNRRLPGMCALCSISDTGQGMDTETLRRAFEPFFTTKEGLGQKGLGLPIAYHIVKEHNGSMSLESDPGKGTTVKVYLPLLRSGIEKVEPIPLASSINAAPIYNANYTRASNGKQVGL